MTLCPGDQGRERGGREVGGGALGGGLTLAPFPLSVCICVTVCVFVHVCVLAGWAVPASRLVSEDQRAGMTG